MLRYVSKWVRQALVMLGVLLGLSPAAFAQTNLERGTYTLTNNVAHDNPVGQGMARSYTEEQSDLAVSQDGLWFTLGFNNTQYMGEFTIKVNGSQVSYEVVYNSNNIKKLKFKIPSLDAAIGVGMHVVPMNTNVEYTVTLNQSSLKLIEKEAVEEVKPEEPVTKPESNSGGTDTPAKPQTGTSSNSGSSSGSGSQSAQSGSQNNSAQGTKPQEDAAAQESTKPSDSSAQTSEKSEEAVKVEEAEQGEEGQEAESVEAEEVAAEAEESADENSELQESETETLAGELEELEAIEEAVTETEEKGSLAGIIAVLAVIIAAAGGLYYWYFKKKK